MSTRTWHESAASRKSPKVAAEIATGCSLPEERKKRMRSWKGLTGAWPAVVD